MAQYDGSIRINTDIKIKEARIQLATLENSIVKSANKIDSLRQKLDLTQNTKVPTKEYSALTAELDKQIEKLKEWNDYKQEYSEKGLLDEKKIKSVDNRIAETEQKIKNISSEMQRLDSAGKAFTIGNPEQEEKIAQQIKQEEALLDGKVKKRDLEISKIQALREEEQRLKDIKENAIVSDQKLVDLIERRKQLFRELADMEKAGVGEGYKQYDDKLTDLYGVQSQINQIQKVRDTAMQARASYKNMREVARETFRTMARGLVDIPIAAVKAGVRGLVSAFQKLGSVVRNVAVNSFRMLGNAIKTSLSKVGSLVGNVVSKIKLLGSTAKKSFSDVNKSAKKTGGLMGTIASRFKGIALSLLLFNWVTKAFNGVVKSIKDGFGNLYKDNEQFKASVDDLRASVLTLKNAFAAAFRPLVDVAIPYIQMAADKLTELLNKVGQFTAAITGQTTYTKAIKQTADAFKDAKKAAEGYLSPLDEINKFSSKKDEDEEQTGIMFEEIPIEQKFKDMAEKVKDVFKDLFAPIKEAWNKEGEFVIDSWKFALKEIGKLLKDIGRDFLEVWKQPATIAMLQDILHIIGDIGLVVGTLASKFREAWNANDVGLHILENIRDIFAVIIHNIREAADYTVEWVKTIDFTPLLQGVERLTASLVPFFDFLSGTLADFYTQFLLPLASWTLSEEGIPRLLNVLADFMESVNWEGLRTALSSLYSALEPYAEAVGTGLIDFIERMKEYGVEFLNFLPEHIQAAADALKNGDLPAAFKEFGRISGEAVKTAFNFIREAINIIPWEDIGVWIGSFINGIEWGDISESFFGMFVDLWNGIVESIYNIITTTEWSDIGRQVGASFSNALMDIDWAETGRTLSEAFKAFFTLIYEAIEAVDWYGVGQKVKEFIVNIDWNGIADTFFRAVGAIFGGFAAFLWGIIEEAWNSVVQWWHDAAYEDGQFTIQGLFDGIISVLSDIGAWVKEHIFQPFIDGFKNAFGIHSPSTVMMEMGTYIIQGLLDGINSLVENVTQIWQSMKETAVEIWNAVKENLSETWENIRATAKEKWDSIKQNLKETWENLKTDAKEKWESIKESMSQNVESMKTKAGELGDKISSLKEKTRSAFDSMKDKIASASDSMKSKLDGFIDKVRAAIDAVKDFLSSGWEKVKSGFSSGDSGQSYSTRSYSMRSLSAPAVHPAIAKLANIDIPGYATGQVIPTSMKRHLAWLGDNPRETEVVSPLSTIEQAVINAMAKVGAVGNGGNAGGNTYNVKAIANGNIIFDMIIEEGKTRMMSSGRNPFDLNTT